MEVETGWSMDPSSDRKLGSQGSSLLWVNASAKVMSQSSHLQVKELGMLMANQVALVYKG